ncbi:hypothetical protein BD779DRAFT_1557228, partial [Infundibulicybe gibba]
MNQTVDDGLGDSLAGLQVQYSPGETKATKAYNNTWSSATARARRISRLYFLPGMCLCNCRNGSCIAYPRYCNL